MPTLRTKHGVPVILFGRGDISMGTGVVEAWPMGQPSGVLSLSAVEAGAVGRELDGDEAPDFATLCFESLPAIDTVILALTRLRAKMVESGHFAKP